MKIPKDATLREVRSMLDNPDVLVSRAFGVIHQLAKSHGEVRCRLGITGTGKFPNYRIEAPSGHPIMAINGTNHEPWPDGEAFDGATTWSEATMSKLEIEILLGEIRNFKRLKP
jgi:hypothetical protein